MSSGKGPNNLPDQPSTENDKGPTVDGTPTIGDVLSPEVVAQLPQEVQILLSREVRSGPLPTPEDLKRYAEILPDAPERIFSQWERQTAHRQALENKDSIREDIALNGSIADSRRGQWLAFVICISIVAAGVYVAATGHPWPGVLMGTTGMASLVYAFRAGRDFSAREAAATAARDQMDQDRENRDNK